MMCVYCAVRTECLYSVWCVFTARYGLSVCIACNVFFSLQMINVHLQKQQQLNTHKGLSLMTLHKHCTTADRVDCTG